jgi:hypothetical protein
MDVPELKLNLTRPSALVSVAAVVSTPPVKDRLLALLRTLVLTLVIVVDVEVVAELTVMENALL